MLLTVLLFSFGCVGGQDFAAYYGDFKKMIVRNGGSEQNLVPGTIGQLSALELEMASFQGVLDKEPLSQDREAARLLVELETNLIQMQKAVLESREQSSFANLAFPSCTPTSNLGKAIAALDTANAQATLAKANLQSFRNDYAALSLQTGIQWEQMGLSIDASKESIQNQKETLQGFCP